MKRMAIVLTAVVAVLVPISNVGACRRPRSWNWNGGSSARSVACNSSAHPRATTRGRALAMVGAVRDEGWRRYFLLPMAECRATRLAGP